MKIFTFGKAKNRTRLLQKAARITRNAGDSYQDALNLQGKEQFTKLLRQGIQISMSTAV